jgi:catalase
LLLVINSVQLQEFGKLHLTKNPENYHRDVDQAAFSPGSMVPGIEDSPDSLLQFRMFFYRDAQFHRLGSTNLHQIPVNCPFMAGSFSSLNFDGNMRVDANNGGNPDYAPNSYTPLTKFRPDAAEAPYRVSDPVVSRKSHFYHEGKISEYDQPRELYENVMDDTQREHLHSNTAVMLAHVSDPKIQYLYLAQQYCIKPSYAKAIYDLLPEKKFDFSKVEEMAKDAHTRTKAPRFMHNNDQERLVGMPVQGIYNF